MVSASASRATPRRSYRSWLNVFLRFGRSFSGRCGRLRPRRGSGRRSGRRPARRPSCPGSPSGSGRRCRAWPAPRRRGRSRWRRRWSTDSSWYGPSWPIRTVTVPPVGGLAEQLEQHDVLLERLEQRPDGGVEAVAEPGEVGGAADGDPLVGAVVGHRLDQRVDHGGDGVRPARPRDDAAAARSPRRRSLAGRGAVDPRAQVGERVVVELGVELDQPLLDPAGAEDQHHAAAGSGPAPPARRGAPWSARAWGTARPRPGGSAARAAAPTAARRRRGRRRRRGWSRSRASRRRSSA